MKEAEDNRAPHGWTMMIMSLCRGFIVVNINGLMWTLLHCWLLWLAAKVFNWQRFVINFTAIYSARMDFVN